MEWMQVDTHYHSYSFDTQLHIVRPFMRLIDVGSRDLYGQCVPMAVHTTNHTRHVYAVIVMLIFRRQGANSRRLMRLIL